LALAGNAAAAMQILGRRWVPELIYLLTLRSARFSELSTALPAVSNRVLTERLRELTAAGVVVRTVEPGPPTRITYALSAAGRDLGEALHQAGRWADGR
jgi:DNA-binding HxlR family transcriptional regulator